MVRNAVFAPWTRYQPDSVSPQASASTPTPDHPPATRTVGEEERQQLARRAGIVGLGTLASRLLGLVRDQVIAALFTRAATDAFFVAFTIPNVLRQLVAEGAVQTAVLPVLETTKEKDGPEAARHAFACLRGLSLIVLSILTVLGVLGAPYLVELFAGGYREQPGQFERTVTLTRALFPYIFFMGTAALGVAALNIHRRFVVTSFAPGLLNVAFVLGALLLSGPLLANGADPVLSLAVGALTGGLLQVLAQWPSLAHIGYLTVPRITLSHPAVREVWRRMGPTLFGIGIYYVDVVLARRFLSELGLGAQSYFGWALRLCDFPQGIFVMALQTATLPSLTRLVARGDLEEVKKTFCYAMRLTLFVAIPSTLLFVSLAEPITALVFQRGHFDALSVRETARALTAQGAGIWMVAAVRQLVSVFYAFGDTRTPVRIAATDLAVFVTLSLTLRNLGHVGVSIAVTGASLTQMALLFWRAERRLPGMLSRELLGSTARTLGAGLIASLAGLASSSVLAPLAQNQLGRVTHGLLAVLSFGGTFLIAAWLLRHPELLALIGGLRRRLNRPLRP